jgi:hypothetical protein
MSIIVCGLSHLPALMTSRRPSHLVTLLDPASMIETPAGHDPALHLKLGINDITGPARGLVPPDETSVNRLLDFGRTWNGEAPMIIHCWAGVSRSTASAFILACERAPDQDEAQLASQMRRLAPHAYPNRRLVALADRLMGRQGRMVEAVEAMGENDFLVDSRPFELPVRHP